MSSHVSKKRANSYIESQQSQIAELTVTSSALQQKIENLEREMQQLLQTNTQLKKEINYLKNENDNLKLQQRQEGIFQVETEHLRNDNQRLINLLGGQSKDLRFLNNLETEKSNVPECLLWVPKKAFEIAHKFKVENQDSDLISDKQIQLLLFELNKVWAVQQFEQTKLQKSINELEKKKIQSKSNVSYQEFQLTQQIERLKQQIKDLKRENLELYANRPERGTRSIRIASANNTKK